VLALALASALTMTAAAWVAPASMHGQTLESPSPWTRAESARFEIHYPPALSSELARITASAERAYDRISARLDFVLGTKVPLVVFAPGGSITRDQAVAYAVGDGVAPQTPHRSRIVLPLPAADTELDALLTHELSHLLFCEIILPQQSGTGGLPRWVLEGIATHIVGIWSADAERLLRELVRSDTLPALSSLTGDGGFANPRANDAVGHAAFDFIESRWGATGLRRFVDGLHVPRVDRTYDAVFELSPPEFDAAFRAWARTRYGASR
jgi:hypothetical protein